MDAMRVAVSCPDEAEVAAIAARLRGATVEPCDDRGAADGCHAVMLVGAGSGAGRFLSARTAVLLVADPSPSPDTTEALFAASRNARVQLAVVNPDRYLPSRQLVRKQLAAIGEPGLLRLHRWEPAGSSVEKSGLPDPVLRDLDVTL